LIIIKSGENGSQHIYLHKSLQVSGINYNKLRNSKGGTRKEARYPRGWEIMRQVIEPAIILANKTMVRRHRSNDPTSLA
jgi:hypothetical protein